MNCDLVTTVEPDYVRVTVTGEYSFGNMFKFIELVRSIAIENARTRMLMDCRLLTGSMTEADRFQGGQKIAEVFGPRIRVGLLMQAEQITKLGELAAVNRGAIFMVDSSEAELMPWLLKA